MQFVDMSTPDHLLSRSIRIAIFVAMLAALMVAFPGIAGAQMDPVSCGHFESREAAQEHFETHELEFPGVMDPDEDGIACEFAFGGEVTEPAYVSSQVTSLPSTGTGPGADVERSVNEGGTFNPLVAVLLMLITWAAALTHRRSSR
jgi:hypothetical protein